MSTTTLNRIMDIFDSHQRWQEETDTIQRRPSATNDSTPEMVAMQKIYQVFHEQVKKKGQQEPKLQQELLAAALVQIMTAAMSNLVQEGIVSMSQLKSSSLYDSITKISNLCANIMLRMNYNWNPKGNSNPSIIMVNILMEHMAKFAGVEMESIRIFVVEFLNQCLMILMEFKEKEQYDEEMDSEETEDPNSDWRNQECLIRIKEILLSRLKDKSQAVRSVAIEACGTIFHTSCFSSSCSYSSTSSSSSSFSSYPPKYIHSELYHPDVVEALLWNMRHDPSFANRSMALRAIPVNQSTVPEIVERVRDSKIKVRIDALEILRTKVDVQDLTSSQRAHILQIGLSKRYPQTLVAACKLLCCGWMKTKKFDPISTLDLLDPILHEDVCMQSAKIILAVASDDFVHTESMGEIAFDMVLSELSPPEIRAFKEQVLKRPCIQKDGKDDDFLNAASILFMNAYCNVIQESKSLLDHKKASQISDIIPDVTVLGQVLMKHVKRLETVSNELRVFQEEQDDPNKIEVYEQGEELECFICLYLLKLSKVVDLTEEGSRRHFSSILHRILCNITTHEDLIEECVHALFASQDNENSFLIALSEILASIIPNEDDLVHAEDKNERRRHYLRGISILTVALEKVSRKMSSNPILQNVSAIILASITDPSLGSLVREAGVSCLGRFVILMDENVIMDKFKPLLIEIAYSEQELVDIRAQALLAITDLSLLFQRFLTPVSLSSDEHEISVTDLLLKCLQDDSTSLSIISAECSAKLLLNGKIHDANIMGQLIVTYFDKDTSVDEDDDDIEEAVKEVGNPTRLHQLLTIFFPAYSMSSKIARDTFTSSFRPILDIIHKKITSKKRGKKSTATWPIAKMIDYICQTLEHEETDKSAKEKENDDSNASPLLIATIAICEFIQEEVDNMTVSHLRNLCKILSKTYIDIESEDKLALNLLKRRIGDLYDTIDDSSASRSIEPLVVILDEVVDVNAGELSDDDNVQNFKEVAKAQHEHAGKNGIEEIMNDVRDSEDDPSIHSGDESDEFESEEDSD